MSSKLCGFLDSQEAWVGLVLATLVQHCLGAAYFNSWFSKPWSYFTAMDRGLPKLDDEFFSSTFSFCTCIGASLVGSFLRALGVLIVVSAAGATTFCGYFEAAGIVSFMVLAASHHDLWSQRPWPLLFINFGYDVLCIVVASVILFATEKYF